ncbi:rod shape-determining protein [Arcobacter sp. YIC-80]|uniref:rod shape-determining protein n=1 Tax=unclassified Arcobacter TaxID=2593671 RepID=UPI00384B7C4E
MFNTLSNLIAPNIAIDLGTANIIVTTKDKGVIINEPSVVAIQKNNKGENKVIAVGLEAKRMLGKTPLHIKAVRPMQDGVIADFDTTETMINYFIQKAYKKNFFFKPKIIICIPYGVTPVERNAVKESAIAAGARKVYLIEEPLAAAIGAGIPVNSPDGHVVVDIGSGTTEIGLTSLGGLVLCKATRTAGDSFDAQIVKFIKQNYSLTIGSEAAEKVKFAIGTAIKLEKPLTVKVKGKDNFGFLKTIELNSEEFRKAISEPLKEISNSIRKLLEQMPPDLAADVIDNGVVLTGGGALLRGIDKYLSNIIKLPVHISEEPLMAVSNGTTEVLKNMELLNLLED